MAEMVEPVAEMVEPNTKIMKLDLEIAQKTIEKLTLQLEHEKTGNQLARTVYSMDKDPANKTIGALHSQLTQEKKLHKRKSDTVNFLQMELAKKDREIIEWKEKFKKANYNERYMSSYLEQYCGKVQYEDGKFVGINSSY